MPADDPELLDRIHQKARTPLEDLRRRTSEEIHSYPSPIAGCDAQFNHLLEQRTNIAAELQRLAHIGEWRGRGAEYAAMLEAFVSSSAYLDERTKQELRAGLKAAVGALATA
jgi:hypothetical protein